MARACGSRARIVIVVVVIIVVDIVTSTAQHHRQAIISQPTLTRVYVCIHLHKHIVFERGVCQRVVCLAYVD
jgi:hypothetical protein